MQCDRFTELFTCGSSAHVHSESGDLYSVTLHYLYSLCNVPDMHVFYMWLQKPHEGMF